MLHCSASLAGCGPLGGGRRSRLDVAAAHLDTAQSLPIAPLQQRVPLRRSAAVAARVVVVARLPLHCLMSAAGEVALHVSRRTKAITR